MYNPKTIICGIIIMEDWYNPIDLPNNLVISTTFVKKVLLNDPRVNSWIQWVSENEVIQFLLLQKQWTMLPKTDI
jgi:hypothetical protein